MSDHRPDGFYWARRPQGWTVVRVEIILKNDEDPIYEIGSEIPLRWDEIEEWGERLDPPKERSA